MTAGARQHILFDCDTGIDDSLALLYLLASPAAHLAGIASTAGNVGAQQVAANNLAWLDVCQAPDIEVAVGSAAPLAIPLRTTEDTHGPQGIGNAVLPVSRREVSARTAAGLWIALARQYPGELTGLCTGPLTNLALALRAEPELPRLLKQLVIMGGAFQHPGNTTPVAEWNVFVDPEAAHEVFAAFSDSPVRPIVCPLDLTETMEMRPAHVARLAQIARSTPVEALTAQDPASIRSAASNPIVRHLTDAVRYYMNFHRDEGQGFLAHVHDPFAAAVALDNSLITTRPATVDVELTGARTRAATIADWTGMWGRKPNADIAIAASPDLFFDRMLQRVGTFARAVYPA